MAKKKNARESQRDVSTAKTLKAPRQLWVPIYSDEQFKRASQGLEPFEAYLTLKAAKAAAPNAIVVGPLVLAERTRQR